VEIKKETDLVQVLHQATEAKIVVKQKQKKISKLAMFNYSKQLRILCPYPFIEERNFYLNN